MQEMGLDDGMVYSGASAGSGLAVLVASGVEAGRICNKAAELLEPFQGLNILRHSDVLISFADAFLEHFIDEETVVKLGGRVHVSITQLSPFQNQLVSDFEDKRDLCKAIRASCHIPSPRVPTVPFRGHRCIDGGATRNTPLVGERCLTVSPFSFGRRCDIQPKKRLNPFRAIMIPSPAQAQELYRWGREDGLRKFESLEQGEELRRKKKEGDILVSKVKRIDPSPIHSTIT